jgi:multicomponent Na+:H+ antiporter subunit D
MIRTQTLLFPGQLDDLLVVIGVATMVVGIIGAISHYDMKRILSFHIVSQIGYMVFGLGVGGATALAATVFFLVHQIPVKTSLFLVEGVVSRDSGSSSFDSVSGLARRSPWLAVLFLAPALSLAGLPPMSGFLGKFALVRAGFSAEHYLAVGIALAVSLFTLVSMLKIWVGAFWGEVAPAHKAGVVGVLRHQKSMGAATAVIVAITIVIAVFAGPLYEYAIRAADQLLDVAGYVSAVRNA